MTFSPTALHAYLPPDNSRATSGRWWVALSGGLDSCVLLHALVQLNLPVPLYALHVNHQLSPNANDWECHCAAFCAALNVPFTAEKVNVKNSGRGIEDAAREARYQVFAQYLQTGDCLLTAHHADDQAETILLRLLRGSGPRGLAAIARTRTLASGQVHRPLLNFSRAELAAYAVAQHLTWVDDESNANHHYDRNYLRHQVMPLLRNRWPQFLQKWQTTADLCAANEQLLDELAVQDLASTLPQEEYGGSSILISPLAQLTPARRHNLLRYWLRLQGLSTPEQQHLTQIERQLTDIRPDALTQINFADVSLRLYRDRLFALPLTQLLREVDSTSVQPLSLPTESVAAQPLLVSLPSGAQLVFSRARRSAKAYLRCDLPDLSVRFRQGGERCKPAGRNHSQTLKRLLQDAGLPPWLRDNLPLIYSGDLLVAVADLWVCEGFQADDEGWEIGYKPVRVSV